MQIRELKEQEIDKWDAYVLDHPDSTFFHRGGWKEVIEQSFGHRCYFFYAESGGEICGVLPLGHISSMVFGKSLISTPFCVYGGAIANDEDARAMLIEHARKLARELDVDYLELRHRRQFNPAWACKKDLYVTFRKTIELDVEQNMKSIPRKQRAMVRKGINAGLESEIDNEIELFYKTYAISVRNLGTPVFSKKYFQKLKEVFKDDCEILIVTKGHRVISSVMNFYFRNEVLPYYGGGTDEARAFKANDFMYWEVMRRACLKGIEIFDYGRSKVGTGSYSFKKNWGFEPEPLFYEYDLCKAEALPDINPLNPKYKLFINMWKRLPTSVSNVVGPYIVRNIG